MNCVLFSAAIVAAAFKPLPKVDRDTKPLDFHTGRNFQGALDGKLSVEWHNVPLREMLRGLEKVKRVSIILDRRIDPTQKPDLKLKSVTVQQAMEAIAKSVKAKEVVVGHVIYIGPTSRAEALKILVKVREDQLRQILRSVPAAKRVQFTRRQTVHWQDLDSPKEIVASIAKAFSLKVTGEKLIPHDLWARGSLPAMSQAQMLSLVLIQFDLTFRWHPDGKGVEIVPISRNGGKRGSD